MMSAAEEVDYTKDPVYQRKLAEAEEADREYEEGQALRHVAEIGAMLDQAEARRKATVPVQPKPEKTVEEVVVPETDPDSIDNRLRAELSARGQAKVRKDEDRAMRMAVARNEPGSAEAYEASLFAEQVETYATADQALRKTEANRLRGEVQEDYDRETSRVIAVLHNVQTHANDGMRPASDETRRRLAELNRQVDKRIQGRDEAIEDAVRAGQAERTATRASGRLTDIIGPPPTEDVETLEMLEARFEASKAIYGPSYSVAQWNRDGRP
jgi:hypothetical protein